MKTSTDIEFDFKAWRREYRARYDDLREKIYDALYAGQTVLEIRANGESTWNLREHRVFIPSAYTPAYIADHLISRHEHFGFTLRFQDGSTYESGKEVTK